MHLTRDAVLAWMADREPGPPPALAVRIETAVGQAPERCFAQNLPAVLAALGRWLLEEVLASADESRAVAADLLAADALMTYALEAQAEQNIDGLESFATRLGT